MTAEGEQTPEEQPPGEQTAGEERSPRERTETLPTPRLVGLHIYPLKSAGGITVDEAAVDPVGLRWDRRWMFVDEGGRFVSQRTHPRMALLRVEMDDATLRVTAPDTAGQALDLPLAPPSRDRGHEEIVVWHGGRYAVDCGPEPAAWVTEFLGAPCRVVRSVNPRARAALSPSGTVLAGFADAAPALAISIASLDDLNRRLAEPIPMNRFRPNLVLAGLPPYAEDRLGRVRVGDVVLRAIRPCARCATTTVDQDTAETGKEPLRTLGTYRRLPDGTVGFGVNARFETAGTLRAGARVEREPTAPA